MSSNSKERKTQVLTDETGNRRFFIPDGVGLSSAEAHALWTRLVGDVRASLREDEGEVNP